MGSKVTEIKNIFGSKGALESLRMADTSDEAYTEMVDRIRAKYRQMKLDNMRPEYLSIMIGDKRLTDDPAVDDGTLKAVGGVIDNCIDVYQGFSKARRLELASNNILEVSNKKLVIGGIDVSNILGQVAKVTSALDLGTATKIISVVGKAIKAAQAAGNVVGDVLNSIGEAKENASNAEMKKLTKEFKTASELEKNLAFLVTDLLNVKKQLKNCDKYKIDQGPFRVFMQSVLSEVEQYEKNSSKREEELMDEANRIGEILQAISEKKKLIRRIQNFNDKIKSAKPAPTDHTY